MFEPWGTVADAQVATEVAGVRPGPGLAGALSRAELPDVSDDAVLELIAGWTRLASWASAGQAAAVAELARRRLDGPLDAAGRSTRDGTPNEFTADELAITLRLPLPTAARLLDFAISLDRLPGTRDALTRGLIDPARAKVITTAVSGLPETTGRAIENQVLDEASEQTSGQLRATIGRAVLAADPAGLSDGLCNKISYELKECT